MKTIAFLMMICMVIISGFPGNGQAIQQKAKMDCCEKSGKDIPCSHQQKQDCKHGMCLTRLCCSVAGFIPAAYLSLSDILPETKRNLKIPFAEDKLSGYSDKAFHPPKV